MLDWLLGIQGTDWSDVSSWRVVFLQPIAAWFIFMVLLPAVGYLCWWIYKHEKGFLTSWRRYVLLGLRVAALMVLLMMFMEPVISMDRQIARRGTVFVLIDQSKSMTLHDGQYSDADRSALARVVRGANGETVSSEKILELPRLELVKGVLRNRDIHVLDSFKADHEVKVFTFSSAVRFLEALTADAIVADGDVTRMGDAVLTALKDARGGPVDAVVVFTDGRSNAGLTLASLSKILTERNEPIPVYTIGAGSDQPPKDIHLMELVAEPVVLLNDDIVFQYELEQHGFDGQQVQVQLLDGQRVVHTQKLTLGAGGVRQRETLKIKAEKAGEFKFTLSIAPQEGELVKENNQQSQPVVVVDKKVKVLYVEGRPRWEYRYLKNALIRDNTLEVWCYLLDADLNFKQEVSLSLAASDPGLKRFPSDLKELEKFDVIILGDVDLKALGEPKRPGDPVVDAHRVAENLNQFVSLLGGGLILIAGSDSNPFGYVNTPLENLLPVVIPSSNPSPGMIFKDPFHVRLTPSGKEDPLMQMLPDAQANVEFWEDRDARQASLPPMYWYLPLKETKPAARVLATHPSGAPLMVTQNYGSGQVLWMATDETWRWRGLGGDQYFYRFWGKSIHRLRKRMGNKRYALYMNASYALGEPVVVEARVLDEQLKPSTQEKVTAEVSGSSQEKQNVELNLVPGKDGTYRGTFEPKKEGEYRIWIGPETDRQKGTMETFSVTMKVLEFVHTTMDSAALKTLAQDTGGAFFYLHETPKLAEAVKNIKHTSYHETKQRNLWDTPLALLLFSALIITEWALRKRWGLA